MSVGRLHLRIVNWMTEKENRRYTMGGRHSLVNVDLLVTIVAVLVWA
jgi:hypothetical protein